MSIELTKNGSLPNKRIIKTVLSGNLPGIKGIKHCGM